MQLNFTFRVKEFIKSNPNPNPKPKPSPNLNLKAKPTSTPKPNLNHKVLDNQLNIARNLVNDLSICRASIGDHPNKV